MNIAEQIPLLSQLPPGLQDAILQFILLVVVLAVIWVLRRAVAWLVVRPLRVLVQRSDNDLDDRAIEAMLGPVRWVIVALGISLTVNILNFDQTINLVGSVISRTILIIAAFFAALRIFGLITFDRDTILRFTGISIQERLIPFLRTAIQMILVILAIVIILQEWGFEVNGLIASLGIVGLAFSLAAQDTVSNLFGFTAIVGDNPFKVGDFINTPDVSGIVEHVGVRSTRVRQLNQAIVTVPNSKLANAVILNWSRLSKRWVDFKLGVTYSTNARQMRALLERLRTMLASRELVDPNSVVVYFTDFNDSSLDVLIRCYIYLADWGEFQAEKERINLEIMELVEEMGLSIAFPSRSVYLETFPGIEDETTASAMPLPRPIPAASYSERESAQSQGISNEGDQVGDAGQEASESEGR